jgi:hypothetical protein
MNGAANKTQIKLNYGDSRTICHAVRRRHAETLLALLSLIAPKILD